MNKMTITAQVSTKKNAGERKEENLDYMLTGSVQGKDSVAYDKGSDIMWNGVGVSAKSSHFTLMSAKLAKGETMAEQLDFYFATVHSTVFAYITEKDDVYMMNAIEFREFLEVFCHMERESSKNGGGWKVRCRAESKKMLNWFEIRLNG
jgi:hypothetical protein